MKQSFLILFLAGMLYSCQKENVVTNTAPIPELENVTVENGRLHFPDEATYRNAEIALNAEEKIPLTEWHKSLKFAPMAKLMEQLHIDFAKVTTQTEWETLQAAYKDYWQLTANNSLSIYGYQPFLEQLLNHDGEVMVGKALLKYTNTHKITILDGDATKINTALRTLQSDEAAGILVTPIDQGIDIAANARSCSDYIIWQTCTSGSNYRTVGRYYLDNDFGTINSSTQPSTPVVIVSTLRVTVHPEYKGFFGIWYRAQTDITWSIGWGAYSPQDLNPMGPLHPSPPIAHGTGWTAYNTQAINYIYSIRNPGVYIRYDQVGHYSYYFDYMFANIETPIMSCAENCP